MALAKKLITTSILVLSLCGTALAGPILWVGDSGGILGTVDVATGNVTVIGDMGTAMTDIAFDPSGNLYAITFETLYSVNKTTAATTFIGSLGTSLNSLVFDDSGTLYGANTSLYTIDTTTGAASSVGSGGGYNSSGDLAFIGGELYLSSAPGDTLYNLDTTTGVGTLIGAIEFDDVYGLATDNNLDLYGLSGSTVISVDVTTGAGTALVDYSGQGLGIAYGSAFESEAGGSVPEPTTLALMGLGLAGIGFARKKRQY